MISSTFGCQRRQFLIDDTPRACDFAAFHNLDLTRHLDPQLLPAWRLDEYAQRMAGLPALRAYLASRPQLTGVSTAPKLVIDGIGHPTGTQQSRSAHPAQDNRPGPPP